MKKLILFISLLAAVPVWAQSEWTPQKTVEQQQEEMRDAQREARRTAKQAQRDAKKAAKEARKAAKQQAKMAKSQHAAAAAIQPMPTLQPKPEPARKQTVAVPVAETSKDARYLRPGCVPTDAEGKVVFTLDIAPRGLSAHDIYERLHTYLDNLARDDHQNKRIGIVMVNEKEHKIVARYNEWLNFASSFIMLDRSEFSYYIMADCADGRLHLTLERITYAYETGQKGGFTLPAREVISDKYAVNKKHTKLRPTYGKFRRKTIDRVDEVFGQITNLFKQ